MGELFGAGSLTEMERGQFPEANYGNISHLSSSCS
jgi:hypothetical protein